MLLGKRPRPPVMKRTRSMSGGLAEDTPQDEEYIVKDDLGGGLMVPRPQQQQQQNPPVILLQQTPHFLRTCGLCNCRLAPGRDIYMYRGDTAFCSLECREQQIKQDQRKEKWKVASIREEKTITVVYPNQPTATADPSTKTQTAACT